MMFNGQRDMNLFNKLNQQLIQKFIDTTVQLLKLDPTSTKQNVYGQAMTKFYMQPIKLYALIQHQQPQIVDQLYGVNYQNFLKLRLNIQMLKQIKVYPEVGDVIKYNKSDFQISKVINNQFIGGQVKNQFSLILHCVHTAVSKTQTSGNTKVGIQQRKSNIYGDKL